MVMLFFSKPKTAYELRISDWSSDVCSSDLAGSIDSHIYLSLISGTHLGPAAVTGLPIAGLLLRRRRARIDAFNQEIGRASCRDSACQYVWISVVGVSFKQKVCRITRRPNLTQPTSVI